MSARPTWRGFLKISLVTLPIKVYPATESAGALTFHQLHAACQTRIQQKRWCPHCQAEVPASALVKGHEFERGKYVILTDDDLDQVQPPSTRIIDLVQFADVAALDPMHVDRTYYLAPDGALAAAAYAVLREGLRGTVGIGKLAIYGREYLIAVRTLDRRALVLHTLHHAATCRPIDAIPDLATVPAIAPADQVALARHLIAALEGPLDLADYTDAYRAQLQRVIDAKIAGEQIVIPPTPTPAIVNLAEALRSSLDALGRGKRRSAKAAPRKKTRPRVA
jgi:DNA end-binding protein Ku